MKKHMNWIRAALAIMALLRCGSVRADDWTGWCAVAGGGCSALAGGTLTLSGTVGQPAAGFCVDGSFTMIACFWAGDETASILPWLTITPAGANVIVSWPSWANAYALQTSFTLTTPIWAPVSTQPALVGDHYQVLLPAIESNQFFRLISQ